MSKFLYVTDQDEYTDHSFIGPLFQKYLNRHFEINTIFFSKSKYDIEIKDDGRIIIPEKFSSTLLEELENKKQIILKPKHCLGFFLNTMLLFL